VKEETPSANRQIARAAGVVMAGFVLSNLTGLFRQILVLDVFGTEKTIDAFYAAAQLPETLFMLVAGGALASAFIPTFTGYIEGGDKDTAWHLASSVMNLITLVLVLTSFIAFVFAPQVVSSLLAPNFPPAQQALTVSLLKILLISPFVFGISGLLMGILNTHQHFLLPALAPTMHWIGWILGVWIFVPKYGIHGLAWGAVLGAVLHLGVQIPALINLKGRYFFSLGLRSAGVREVARLMGPRLIGVSVVQLNFWVNVILASGQPTGSLTAIKTAFAVMTMPQVVIAQAIAIAALPTFSAQVARSEIYAMRTSLAATLRGVILLALPAMFGLLLLRTPIVAMLFERGAFDSNSTQLAAWALLWYTTGLISHSVVEIVARAFYALHDTKTPVIFGSIAMGLNVILSIGFSAWFSQIGWAPHGGLALANSVATTLEMVVLLIVMRKRLGGLDGKHIFIGTGQSLIAGIAMSLGIWGWLSASSGWSVWIISLGGITIGGMIYGIFAILLRIPEARVLLATINYRIPRKIG